LIIDRDKGIGVKDKFLECLLELGIELKDYSGVVHGRQFRYLPTLGEAQVGIEDFDGWARSVDLIFYVWLPAGRRHFIRWFNDNAPINKETMK
jgi:hypothetical protein